MNLEAQKHVDASTARQAKAQAAWAHRNMDATVSALSEALAELTAAVEILARR